MPAANYHSLHCAVLVLKVLELTAEYTAQPDDALRAKLSAVAGIQMTLQWGDGTKKVALKMENLGVMVRVYVQFSESPLEKIELLLDMMTTLLEKRFDDEESQSQTEFFFKATMKEKTFVYYFISILLELVGSFKLLKFTGRNASEAIPLALRHADALRTLFGYCKQFQKNPLILSHAVKHGIVYLEAIIKKMDFFEKHLKTHTADVLSILQSTQRCTRVLQAICGQGKRKRTMSITRNVPKVKHAMERFVFQTKSMFQRNGLSKAYKQGNLKNKTLDGVEILSQIPNLSDDERTEEDEGTQKAKKVASSAAKKRKRQSKEKKQSKKKNKKKKEEEEKEKEEEEEDETIDDDDDDEATQEALR